MKLLGVLLFLLTGQFSFAVENKSPLVIDIIKKGGSLIFLTPEFVQPRRMIIYQDKIRKLDNELSDAIPSPWTVACLAEFSTSEDRHFAIGDTYRFAKFDPYMGSRYTIYDLKNGNYVQTFALKFWSGPIMEISCDWVTSTAEPNITVKDFEKGVGGRMTLH